MTHRKRPCRRCRVYDRVSAGVASSLKLKNLSPNYGGQEFYEFILILYDVLYDFLIFWYRGRRSASLTRLCNISSSYNCINQCIHKFL